MRLRDFCSLPLLAVCCLPLLGSCATTFVSGNALFITEETRQPNDLTLTITVGTSSKVTGMQIDTVGDDTVITRLDSGRARRFILEDLTGYRGRIRLKSVDLVVDGVSVWIDEDSFKAHGVDGSIDVTLREGDVDAFGGRDLILRDGNRLEAVGSQRSH